MSPRDSFDALFREHHAPILAYLQRRTDAVDAADLAAEVFLTAWRRLEDVPRGEGSLLWLYAGSHRVLANHRRGGRRQTRLAGRLAEALRAATPTEVSDDLSWRVRGALDGLRRADREALTLTVWEGLTPSGVAAITGERAGTVRVRLHRARARLREALTRPEETTSDADAAPRPATA